jgi:hypothetical protein
MQGRLSVVALLGVVACGSVPAAPDAAPDGGATPDGPRPPSAECKAQRAVYLVGGTGGFAWFSLIWPAPAVIKAFQAAYAYDTPGNAKDVGVEAAHPLFTRRMGARSLWEGLGKAPQPSVFVAGTNETHTAQPTSILINGTYGLAAAGAVIQTDLAPKIAVLSFSPGGPYGTAPGAPTPVTVTTIDSAVAAFRGKISPELEQQLVPSAAQLARYLPPGAATVEVALGSKLAFTANAFRLGLVGSVIIQAFADDPHSVFTTAPPTERINRLATMLDEFYRDLSTSSELACGEGGRFLSVADNVVTVVVGDTPKNSFDNAGWGDATPGLANWMYLRSNGFTRPGWFGEVVPGTRTNFNPVTGAKDPAATEASSTAAAFAGGLYAITRGDKARVRLLTAAVFDGVTLR